MTKDEMLNECAIKRGERYNKMLDMFRNMQPFKTIRDLPDLPVTDSEDYENIIVPNLIRCGAIPLEKLTIGQTYLGSCRNASEAKWDGKHFIYNRIKFGIRYKEKINHFQEDDGYDLFIPLQEKPFNNNLDKYNNNGERREIPESGKVAETIRI